jgi:hypothetical protein
MMLKDYDIHLDNAYAHISRSSVECLAATKVRRLPHPAYSPDLAPSNIFLFDYLKEKQFIISVETQEELISKIRRNFASVTKDHHITVHMKRMKRQKRVNKNHFEYYDPSTSACPRSASKKVQSYGVYRYSEISVKQ